MLSVTFAPNDSTDYTIASASVTLSVTAVTSAPVVTTGSASVILGSSATMGGQATAEGSDTHVWFLYGTSSTLSGATQTASQDIGAGYSVVNFTAGASGLSPNTTYYFQAVAQNTYGTTQGSIQSFTTASGSTFSLSGSNGGAVTLSKGSTTNNTLMVTISPAGGFTGTVTLNAAVTKSPTGAQDQPTFTWSPSNLVTLSGTSNATATLIISTTAGTSGAIVPLVSPFGRWYSTGGAGPLALCCAGFLAVDVHCDLLGMVALCIALTSGMVACGGSSNTGGNASSNPGTTSGAYTITITGTSGTTTATNTVNLTVQ